MYIIYDDFYLRHFTGPLHVENSGRLSAIIAAIRKSSFFKELDFYRPDKAGPEQVCLVHDRAYMEKIAALSDNAGKFDNNMLFNIDMDTVVSEYTYESAMLAAGAGISGIDMLFGGEKSNIFFALVRPPGHHAFRGRGSGFCIFNNIAIAAAYLIEKYGLKRVAIIDFDVHHGNGTQDIFYEDERVLYISLHQYPHYPGTGDLTEAGRKKGEGFNLNIPIAAGSNENDYIYAVNVIIMPVLRRFNPEFLLFSAGYDAHIDDPLSSINLEDGSYKKIMELILSGCCQLPTRQGTNSTNTGKNTGNMNTGRDSGNINARQDKSSISNRQGTSKMNTGKNNNNNNMPEGKNNSNNNMPEGKNNNSRPGCLKTGIILEGGYNYKATAQSVLETISACLEMPEEGGFSRAVFTERDAGLKPSGTPEDSLNACNLKNFNNIRKLFGI